MFPVEHKKASDIPLEVVKTVASPFALTGVLVARIARAALFTDLWVPSTYVEQAPDKPDKKGNTLLPRKHSIHEKGEVLLRFKAYGVNLGKLLLIIPSIAVAPFVCIGAAIKDHFSSNQSHTFEKLQHWFIDDTLEPSDHNRYDYTEYNKQNPDQK